MTVKHIPGTPLPWKPLDILEPLEAAQNAHYMIHAANAYPKLVETLKELMLRCDGEEGVRADDSNIQTTAAAALLEELGER
ncbi:MAG: hypothetical protein ACYDB1_00600 [Acidiferrobacteraceae bacterium]